MNNTVRTRALYAFLALACLYLAADACNLINTADLLEVPHEQETAPQGAGVSRVWVHQLDEERAKVQILYYLDNDHKSDGTLKVEILDNDNRTVRLAAGLDNLPKGHQGVNVIATRDPASNADAFSTRDVSVTLGDREGNVISQRIVRRQPMDWHPVRAQSSDTTPTSIIAARQRLWRLLDKRDYKTLDQLCTTWRREHTRTTDGWPALAAFQALPTARAIEHDLQGTLAIIREWKTSSTSECAAITEAQLWYRYAWYERGSAGWNELSDTAIQVFRGKLAKARKILEKGRNTLSDNPLWYALYMDLLTESGAGRDRVLRVFHDALMLDNTYYPFYTAAAYTFFPQWGGNYRTMEQFIRTSLGAVDETEAGPLYVHIYTTLNSYFEPEVELFRDTYASWTLMKKGFDTLLARNPDDNTLLNRYASLACQAGDGKTYLKIRLRLTEYLIQPAEWRDNHSPNTCDQTFMKRL